LRRHRGEPVASGAASAASWTGWPRASAHQARPQRGGAWLGFGFTALGNESGAVLTMKNAASAASATRRNARQHARAALGSGGAGIATGSSVGRSRSR